MVRGSVGRTAAGVDGPVQEQGSERGELRQQDEVLERRGRDGVRPAAPLFVLGGRTEKLVPAQRPFAVVPAGRSRRHVQVNSGESVDASVRVRLWQCSGIVKGAQG